MLHNIIAGVIARRHRIIDSLLEALLCRKWVPSAIEVMFLGGGKKKREKQNEICSGVPAQEWGGVLALRFSQIKEGRGELIFKRKKSNKDLASLQRTMVQKLICAAKQQHRDWTVKDKSIS